MKRTIKKIGTLLLAAVMLLAMSVTAFATEGDTETPATTPTEITYINIEKKLTVGEGLSNPEATFTFTITPKDGAPADALTANTLSATFAAGQTSGDHTNDIALSIHADKFSAAGNYTYQISENGQDPVKGYTYDTTKYELDLHIYNKEGENANGLYCAAAVLYKITTAEDGTETREEEKIGGRGGDDITGVSKIPFVNKYAKNESDDDDPEAPPTNPGPLYDVTVTKNVTGNQGDKTKDFTFTVSVSDLKTTRTVNIVKTAKNGQKTTTPINNNNTTVTLKDSESFVITGLLKDEKYEIAETAVEGYTTKVNSADSTDKKASGTIDAADVTVTYENNKQGIVPTGLFLNYKHYWIMGGIALLLAVAFLARRKNRFANDF